MRGRGAEEQNMLVEVQYLGDYLEANNCWWRQPSLVLVIYKMNVASYIL